MAAYLSPRVLMRQRTEAVLPGLRTIPGLVDLIIERSRGMDVPVQDAPVLLWYADDSTASLVSTAGTARRFRDTVKLTFRIFTRALAIEAAETEMDALADGLRNLLLTSPTFGAAPVYQIPSMEMAQSVDSKEGKTLFRALFTLDVVIEDQFVPAITDPLNLIVTTVAVGPANTPTITQTVKLPIP